MKKLILIQIFQLITFMLYGQIDKLRYEKVVIFTYDDKINDYKETDILTVSGMISIDSTKILIDGYLGNTDQIFKITSSEIEKGTKRIIYNCIRDGKNYSIAVTPDKRFLTQIGLKNKFIYELNTTGYSNQKEQFIEIDTKNKDNKPVFLYSTVDKNPLFQEANSDSENNLLIMNYIIQKAGDLNFNKSGKSYVQFIIDESGKVTNPKILSGDNEEFNNFSLKIIKEMPNWKPGVNKGKKVKISHTVLVEIESFL